MIQKGDLRIRHEVLLQEREWCQLSVEVRIRRLKLSTDGTNIKGSEAEAIKRIGELLEKPRN